VIGKGHFSEDRPGVHNLQGELARAFHLEDAHAALLEDEELAVRLAGCVEDFSCS
jgi:N-formylglutamate amidohydrolase